MRARSVRNAGRQGVRALVTGLVVCGGVVLVAPPASAGEPHADLSVSVAFAPGAPKTGEELTFTLTATNDGPDTATDVALGLGLDYPFEVLDAEDGHCLITQYERTTVLCEVGDLSSESEVTATVVVRPLASGLFTLPAVVSSPTDDPDVEDQATSATFLVRPGPSIGERWVQGEWPTIMERDADAGAVAYWGKKFTMAFQAYPRRLEAVPFAIMQSNEYRRLRIREAYERILDRTPGASELDYWVRQAAVLPFEAIERRLLTSREFLSGQDHLVDDVIRIYHAILDRDPTSDELMAAQRAVMEQNRTLASVVLGIQRSSEAYERLAQHYFQLALNRDADALAKYVWKLRLGQGVTPEMMFARLLTTDAVMRDYPPTQDDYGYVGGPVYSSTKATDFTDAFPRLISAPSPISAPAAPR